MASCPTGSVIAVTETCQVVVGEGETTVVEVVTAGPQGPPGPAGPAGNMSVNSTGIVDKSLVVWNADAQEFQANSTWTTDTIVDGANF